MYFVKIVGNRQKKVGLVVVIKMMMVFGSGEYHTHLDLSVPLKCAHWSSVRISEKWKTKVTVLRRKMLFGKRKNGKDRRLAPTRDEITLKLSI